VSAERGIDLESWEFALRRAVLLAGGRQLEQLLKGIGSGLQKDGVFCSCGARMESRGLREKRIKTLLADIQFKRSLFVCPKCAKSRFPGDEALGIVGTGFSPGVVRLMARAGSRDTFKEGRDDLRAYAEIEVTAKDVERVAERTGEEIEAWHSKERAEIMGGELEGEPAERAPVMYVCYDGTGVPMVEWETLGRKGKQPDGGSVTREAKLGCVFTQTALDENGYAVRDDASTTFVGAIESSDEFGNRIYAEAARRGITHAGQVAIICDAARYNWEIAATHFPGATEIVDLYHTREHLHTLCSALLSHGGDAFTSLEKRWRAILDEGKVEKILKEAQKRLPRSGKRRKTAQAEMRFFRRNASRMRYAEYRAQGLFVGSGVVEAGCKTVIGKRLKQSGMEWTVRGANAIIALRCCHLSGRMEEFWEQTAA